jgi:natural product biosynthesis luciferase-like monooxygenase protein
MTRTLRQRLAALTPAERAALTERLHTRAAKPAKALDFSLFYFANAAEDEPRYRFLLDTAKLADRLGFTAVWTPERHFHSFGGLYPNPSVLSAALAMATERVRIRAGSLVLPLHHPIRVCEDWSVIDNLSGGRVGLSFATGWHGTDFALAPDHYADRRERTWDAIGVVRKLWRGEDVDFPGPDGTTVTPTLFPRPVQPELPVWVTASGNPDSFAKAGELGANVLSALIGQSPEHLAANIARYRAARAAHGHDPDAGTVTVMLHAYLDQDATAARDLCAAPLREYLRGYLEQQRDMVGGHDQEGDVEARLDFAYEMYSTQTALIGSPDTVGPLLVRLADAGVDEIACLVDFGVPLDKAVESIHLLARVKDGQADTTAPVTTAPLGIDQDRMRRLELANPAGPANYVTTGLRIRGPLRADALDDALRFVGGRHEALRTTFETRDGVALQRIGADFALRLERFDVTDVPPEERVRAARELRTAFARRPFPDDRPPVRVALIRLAEDDHQLAVVKHHMITDWVSFTVFLRELFGAYRDLSLGRTPDLPPAVPYRAFAERERDRLRGGKLDDQLDHWVKQLDGAPDPVTLPMTGQRPAKQTFEGERAWMLFSHETTAKLNAVSRAERVTPFMTAYTALVACLGHVTGESDLVLGSPTANRDWAPENLLGLLLRPMPLRTRLRPEQTFRSALADVRAVTSAALANAEVPYQALVDRLAPERDLDWLPLFKLRYLFLRWDEPVAISGLTLSPLDTDPRTSLYDGTVSLWDDAHGMFGRIEYNSGLFARDTVVSTIETFATVLDAAVTDPDLRVGDLPTSGSRRFHVDQDELEVRLGDQRPRS